MSKKHLDRKNMKDTGVNEDKLTKELSSRKPVVRMDEHFRIGLKNDLLADFSKKYSRKNIRSAPKGFFSGAWTKGLAGVLAVVAISVVTLYVNRAQFLPKQIPFENVSGVLNDRLERRIPENKPVLSKEHDKEKKSYVKDDSLSREESEKAEAAGPLGSKDNAVPTGAEDDKFSADTRSKSAPAPESTYEPSAQSGKKTAATRHNLESADENVSGGMSETRSLAQKPTAVAEYRFGGRPNSFGDIEKTLAQGRMPARSQVKIDELVNEFAYEVPVIGGLPLSVRIESASSPWNKDQVLFFVTVQAEMSSSDLSVAENAGLRIRYYERSVTKIAAGSFTYVPIHDPDGKESGLSGTFRSGEQASLMIEISGAPNVVPGELLADGELFYKKTGAAVLNNIPFILKYPADMSGSVSDRYRMASAAMYWGKILLGAIPAEPSHFAKIHSILDKVRSNDAASDRKRLADAVRLSQKLSGK